MSHSAVITTMKRHLRERPEVLPVETRTAWDVRTTTITFSDSSQSVIPATILPPLGWLRKQVIWLIQTLGMEKQWNHSR